MTTCLTEGIEAIVRDSLTQCFTSEPTEPWNFLTRNLSTSPFQLPPYIMILWMIGLWIRYCILLPFRLFVLVGGFISFGIAYAFVLLLLPESSDVQILLKKWLFRYLASVFVASWSGYIRYFGRRPGRKANQIYVANHSSLIDLLVLAKDYNFSVIGQKHKSVAGIFQKLMSSAQQHIWFDRDENHERRRVVHLLRDHIRSEENEPMLVFPEGTCTNTEYCIMFKKGSFELGAEVYPVAMRYRKEFGDAYWNSMQCSFVRHLFDLMTSWSVVCDVHYLEPQRIRPGETSAQFASRVQNMICKRACLTRVNWNGFLKRRKISPRFLEQRQRAFAAVIERRMNSGLSPSPSAHALHAMDIHARSKMLEMAEEEHEHRQILTTSEEERSLPMTGARRSRISATMETTTLRRRVRYANAGRGQQEGSVVRAVHGATKVVTDVAQATIRWGIVVMLLAIITVVSIRMTPMSWKRIAAGYASALGAKKAT